MSTRYLRGSVIKNRNDPLDRGLLGEWRFDKPSGLILPDHLGRHALGTIDADGAAGSSWKGSKYGLELVLGANDYVEITSGPSLAAPYTIETFSRHVDSADSKFVVSLAAGFWESNPGFSTNLANSNKPIIYLNGENYRYGSTNLGDNEYHHVVFIVTGTEIADINDAQIFVDAVEESYTTQAVEAPISPSGTIRFGNGDFNGAIALVRIYDRILTANEVRARYQIVRRRMQEFGGLRTPLVEARAPPIVGETTWGHDTAVTETNIRDFSGNWTGTGSISGAGDAEVLELDSGEYMESEVVNTGTDTVTLLQNEYDITGDDVTMRYRHGATEAACLIAGWNNYTVPFVSLGYVQVRMESTL